MTMFVLIKTLSGEKSILLHIPCINVLAFQRKLCLRLMRRLNSLKHVQHFDAHNSNQKEEKEKKKEILSVQLFATNAILRNLLS